MSAPELAGYLRARPFVPLRLHMTDGSTFDIRHPEMAAVTTHTVLWFRDMDEQTGVIEAYDLLSLRHIVRIERLAESTVPD
jgi:hypothetical protein